MAWVTPKTDWVPSAGVTADDMNNIGGNLVDLDTRNKAYPKELTGTATAAGWAGSAAPYTQTVTITGLLANHSGYVGVSNAATATQRAAARVALITVTSQSAGSVALVCDGTKPTVDIPILAVISGLKVV